MSKDATVTLRTTARSNQGSGTQQFLHQTKFSTYTTDATSFATDIINWVNSVPQVQSIHCLISVAGSGDLGGSPRYSTIPPGTAVDFQTVSSTQLATPFQLEPEHRNYFAFYPSDYTSQSNLNNAIQREIHRCQIATEYWKL